ncbi:MAG TPA: DNRLRE domain-containing protein [Candidatus Binatia bacterium]|nr:DNRLRE domain-containing protein [Candidatus Binatia bacterium]
MRRIGILLALSALLTLSTAAAASLSLTSQALTPIRNCILSGYPSTTTDVIDAMVEQNNPNTNYNNATNSVMSHSGNTNRRTYVEFLVADCVPAIPPTATIRSATLRLYATAVPAGTCRTDDVFAATSAWTETGITWNTQPTSNSTRTTYMQIGSTCTSNNAAGYVTGWNVTGDVQSYVSGSASDDGWMIRDDAESSATSYTATYEAKNGNSTTENPELIISYVDVP